MKKIIFYGGHYAYNYYGGHPALTNDLYGGHPSASRPALPNLINAVGMFKVKVKISEVLGFKVLTALKGWVGHAPQGRGALLIMTLTLIGRSGALHIIIIYYYLFFFIFFNFFLFFYEKNIILVKLYENRRF